jgi:hypothetical protein
MPRRALATVVLVLPLAACGEDPPPALLVSERVLHVRNLTPETWADVEIWVNDHYRVTRPAVAAGEHLQVPLDVFVAGFGQRFDVTRASVRGVELIATSGDRPVRLVWGTVRRR